MRQVLSGLSLTEDDLVGGESIRQGDEMYLYTIDNTTDRYIGR